MTAIVFSILVLVAILSVCGNIVIRVRLTRAEPSRDKLVWWRRSSDEAGRMYEQLFPGSYLPLFYRNYLLDCSDRSDRRSNHNTLE
jgi:hypothetical protein